MTTLLRRLFLLPIAALLCAGTNAQNDGRYTDHMTCKNNDMELLAPLIQGRADRIAEMQANEAALEAETQAFTLSDVARGSNYVIPVVFHIIHNGGPENITDEQVEDAVRILNDDYNKLNDDWDNVQPEFLAIVADVGITFRLAQLDPNGNCTKGITRTQSPLTNDGTQTMKDLIQWPRNQYLNIWVAASADGAAGYTQNPGAVSAAWAASADGIVVLHDYVGSIGTSSINRSRTLSHEVGHWINLRHCWGPTNNPGLATNCGETDLVSDTPPTIGWTTCFLAGASCGSFQDNVENYMEYSYCGKMFTNGQRTRMLAALNSGTAQRNQLWTPSNLANTGTATGVPLLCAADFGADNKVVCAGSQVTFDDLSYNGATTWIWDFTGGIPATSTDENPVVQYDTPGTYAVTLTAGDGLNTVDLTRNAFITVMPSPGNATPYVQDFDGITSFPSTEFFVENSDGADGFEVTTNTGFSGTHSARLRNINSDLGDVDELISSSYDLSAATQVTLSLRYAFARRASTDDDAFRVYVTNDCGATWSIRKQIASSNTLPTVPDHSSQFTPNDPADWEYMEITNITSNFWVSDFRFKFWFNNGGGNNFYIDDINLNAGPVGIEELTPGTDLSVVPNPVDGAGTVLFNATNASTARVEVLDVLGRSIAVLYDGPVSTGTTRFALPEHLQGGVYFVHAVQDGRDRALRFTMR